MTTAWARDFNNQPRHCWIGFDGLRWLDNRSLGYRPGEKTECTEDHDPKLAGPTEWLRFIRAFGAAAIEQKHDNPFAPGGLTRGYYLLNETGAQTSDGRLTYSETYLRHKGESWGVESVFRVFLDNAAGWARIECYDEDYVGSCEQALGEVERIYGQEVTR